MGLDLNSKAMQGATVRTKSGTGVGKLASLDIDADSGRLNAIRVHTPGLMPRLLNDELIVPWSAVVSMTEQEIIVEDATVSGTARAIAQASG